MKFWCFIILSVSFYMGTFAQESPLIKESRQTPEPETKLSYMSYQLVKRVNNVIATSNPDSVFDYYKHKLPKFIWKSGYYLNTKVGKDSIAVRIFFPNKGSKKHFQDKHLPVLIFYHGGGFVWGSLDMFHMLAQKLSKKLDCIVVLPAYRLAPKYPYPTAVNDCDMVLDWVFQNIATWGGNPQKVGLIGDSAGANLALVTAIKNNRNQTRPLAFQVLYYPSTTMVDTTFSSRSYFAGDKGSWYVLNKPLLQKIKREYLGKTPDTLWQVSPLYAKYKPSMPPTLIITAQCDPLRDEGEALVEKMKQAGVNVSHIRYNKTIHGFVSMYPLISQGRKALHDTQNFAKKYF
ncbi:MAG: esterase [Clostridiales bacterium]|nr:MAG: esterase [Clostridiales bacterium]